MSALAESAAFALIAEIITEIALELRARSSKVFAKQRPRNNNNQGDDRFHPQAVWNFVHLPLLTESFRADKRRRWFTKGNRRVEKEMRILVYEN